MFGHSFRRAGLRTPQTMEPQGPQELDGKLLEGGGQVLRNGVALAAETGKAVRIVNVRAGRSTPGLRKQHVASVRLVAKLTGSVLSGDEVGSCELTVTPPEVRVSRRAVGVAADADGAGSVALMLQAALPALVRLGGSVVLRGGTEGSYAPTIDYVRYVLCPTLRRAFGLQLDVTVVRRGWGNGGGLVGATLSEPVGALPPARGLSGPRGAPKCLHLYIEHAGAKHRPVDEVMEDLCSFFEQELPDWRLVSKSVSGRTVGVRGMSVLVVAETEDGLLFGASAVGGKTQALRACVRELRDDLASGACVDRHMQDQLVALMALAGGESSVRTGPLTLHTRTAVHWASELTGARFERKDKDGVLICRP